MKGLVIYIFSSGNLKNDTLTVTFFNSRVGTTLCSAHLVLLAKAALSENHYYSLWILFLPS